MKKERFFGKNGQTAFLGAAVLVLLICYIDNFHGGSAWIPTYFQHVAVNCLIAAILALGLNFVSGYLGQTSLGHAAFYGIGAYTTAVLLKYTNISFWITIPVGFLLAALVSTGNGFPSCKGTVFDCYHLCILRDLTFHRH